MSGDDAVTWLRPSEVAARFGVNRTTVHRYATRYGIRTKRLPSGYRRYHSGDVEAIAARIDAGETVEPLEH